MKRIMVLIEPTEDFCYEVDVTVIDEAGMVIGRPEWTHYRWPARDLTGMEKPWQKILREVAGLAD